MKDHITKNQEKNYCRAYSGYTETQGVLKETLALSHYSFLCTLLFDILCLLRDHQEDLINYFPSTWHVRPKEGGLHLESPVLEKKDNFALEKFMFFVLLLFGLGPVPNDMLWSSTYFRAKFNMSCELSWRVRQLNFHVQK